MALLPLTAIAEPVEGPFISEEVLVHPDKDGICLRYNTWQSSSKRTVQASNGKVFVDTGIAGFGVEAYLSMGSYVVVLDSATQTTLWSIFVGAFYNALSFVQAEDKSTRTNKLLLWVGGKDDIARLFEIRTGQESYLEKEGNSLIASPENQRQFRGKSLQARQVISGKNSKIQSPKCLRVASTTDWTELWATHSPSNTPSPTVDFDKEMVIGVFFGQGANCNGVSPLHVLDCPDTLELFVRGDYFQSVGGAVPATAYGLFVIPKSVKRVLVKNNVQGLIGGPPIWKEISQFDALAR